MICKIFFLLMALNLFAVAAKADTMGVAGVNGISANSSSVEKGLSKANCIKRVIASFGTNWMNEKIHLNRLSNKSLRKNQVMRTASDLFSQPEMNLGWADETTTMKVTFAF